MVVGAVAATVARPVTLHCTSAPHGPRAKSPSCPSASRARLGRGGCSPAALWNGKAVAVSQWQWTSPRGLKNPVTAPWSPPAKQRGESRRSPQQAAATANSNKYQKLRISCYSALQHIYLFFSFLLERLPWALQWFGFADSFRVTHARRNGPLHVFLVRSE